MDAPRSLRARWIAPMSSPPIENGVVVIDGGRIVDVGRAGDIETRGVVEDLGEVVLLPGLVNTHTHLELSDARPSAQRPASFGAWIVDIVRRQGRVPSVDEMRAATLAGARESLQFGVTTVGDITRTPAITRDALRESPLRVVSFGEVRAMAQRRENLGPHIGTAIDRSAQTDRLSVGISPHAPYSVEPEGYRACVLAAEKHDLPICTHLAESLDEVEFLHDQTGPLRDVWEMLGNWSADVPRWLGSPVALAKSVGLLDAAALLAHVNHADDADLDLLAASRASIVFCPRTHAYFGHAPHRWREMLARGINVCVGTDSRASSPNLSLVDDLRLLHGQAPEVDPASLWTMVTTRAARALRLNDVGAIAPGARADLVCFATKGSDPLRDVLEENVRPSRVIVSGTPLDGV